MRVFLINEFFVKLSESVELSSILAYVLLLAENMETRWFISKSFIFVISSVS
jgi:hypothetical protein